MAPKTAFRFLVMIACSAGVAYGASHIGQLPAGPREVVARIGKWLQAQADPSRSGSAAGVVPPAAPPMVETGSLSHVSGLASGGFVPISKAVSTAPIGQIDTVDANPGQTDRGDSQLEAMASRLRELGASHYQLEKWGADERLFRFTCKVAIDDEACLQQHFEAVADSSAAAIGRVIDHVVQSRSHSR